MRIAADRRGSDEFEGALHFLNGTPGDAVFRVGIERLGGAGGANGLPVGTGAGAIVRGDESVGGVPSIGFAGEFLWVWLVFRQVVWG